MPVLSLSVLFCCLPSFSCPHSFSLYFQYLTLNSLVCDLISYPILLSKIHEILHDLQFHFMIDFPCIYIALYDVTTGNQLEMTYTDIINKLGRLSRDRYSVMADYIKYLYISEYFHVIKTHFHIHIPNISN